jgi:DNA polymerase III alpha subunit (gram-positive type)
MLLYHENVKNTNEQRNMEPKTDTQITEINVNNNEGKYLFLDTETGGTSPNQHSILSIGMVVWEHGELKDELELLIKEPELKVLDSALEVNKINLDDVRAFGKTPQQARIIIQKFLGEHFGGVSYRNLVNIVGHNVTFDIRFLNRLLWLAKAPADYYDKRFTRSPLDTLSIIKFLMEAKQFSLPSFKLGDCLDFFNIEVDEEVRHSALYDAKKTGELFTKLLEYVRLDN